MFNVEWTNFKNNVSSFYFKSGKGPGPGLIVISEALTQFWFCELGVQVGFKGLQNVRGVIWYFPLKLPNLFLDGGNSIPTCVTLCLFLSDIPHFVCPPYMRVAPQLLIAYLCLLSVVLYRLICEFFWRRKNPGAIFHGHPVL